MYNALTSHIDLKQDSTKELKRSLNAKKSNPDTMQIVGHAQEGKSA